jgi:hypothetical protein
MQSSHEPIQQRADMKQDTFTLDEGQVILRWPSQMSAESYEYFKDWLDLITRKAKRASEKYEVSQIRPYGQVK